MDGAHKVPSAEDVGVRRWPPVCAGGWSVEEFISVVADDEAILGMSGREKSNAHIEFVGYCRLFF